MVEKISWITHSILNETSSLLVLLVFKLQLIKNGALTTFFMKEIVTYDKFKGLSWRFHSQQPKKKKKESCSPNKDKMGAVE